MTTVVPVEVYPTPEIASVAIAAEIAKLIRSRNLENRSTVLGLATGSTPVLVYEELIRSHCEEGLSFYNVISFNLDEYIGLDRSHPESYWTFMWKHLFGSIDMRTQNIHIPDGSLPTEAIAEHCAAYEAKIKEVGGIDFQLLGIGRTGHIGFNEPGSARTSRTRPVSLNEITRADAAPAFGGLENVPTHSITMGCATILESKKIALLAWGEKKAGIVKQSLCGEITDQIPASYLQECPQTTYYLDQGAASELD